MSGQAQEWFENEAFWMHYAPIMFDAQQWAQAGGIARQCCAIAALEPGARVLDACCGPGRIAVELALCGLHVTGVDLMQPFLDAASESARDEGVQLELLRQDMRTFTAERPFDAAINCYNSFGYCDEPDDDTRILQRICDALRPGGTFLLECISRETAIRHFTEGEWFERAGQTVLTAFSVEGAWEGLRSKWILIDARTGERREHEFVQRLYSAPELRRTLRTVGFSQADIYGGWDLRPYDYNAQTMLIVATKEAAGIAASAPAASF